MVKLTSRTLKYMGVNNKISKTKAVEYGRFTGSLRNNSEISDDIIEGFEETLNTVAEEIGCNIGDGSVREEGDYEYSYVNGQDIEKFVGYAFVKFNVIMNIDSALQPPDLQKRVLKIWREEIGPEVQSVTVSNYDFEGDEVHTSVEVKL